MKKRMILVLFLIVLFCIFCVKSYADEKKVDENNISNETANRQSSGEVYIEYEYVEAKNTVIATIKSMTELRPTKKSWILSEDKRQYTFEFTTNTKYMTSVVDIHGKETSILVDITQIKEFQLNIEYVYIEESNTVLATVTSNTELKPTKKSWKLSEDRKQYSYEYTTNTNYTTTFYDVNESSICIEIKVTQIKTLVPKVEYKYVENTNTVIATIRTSIGFKPTKKSWKLSEDGKQYSYEFITNTKYETSFTDNNDQTFSILINITQIKEVFANVSYAYDEQKNSVVATISSDVELLPTKILWNLSEDRKKYEFEFTTNTKYETTVMDIYGRTTNILLDINQIDDTAPEVTIDYEFNEDNSITAYIRSNKRLQDTKPTWQLSEDKLVYKKIFFSDQNYTTPVQSPNTQSTLVNINIKIKYQNYEFADGSTVVVRYLYKDNFEVMVEIVSSIELKDTNSTWVMSSDSKTYTKIFRENMVYDTTIVDINNVTKNVPIIIDGFYKQQFKGIDVSGHQGVIDWIAVKNSGIDFAILRCGYGENIKSQDDAYFARNISECERLGIKYGVYIYSYALTENGAISEANHVLRLIQGHNVPLGVWFDMEDADGYKQRHGMPSNETLVNICKNFCDKIKSKGYDVGIYASYYWFTTIINSEKLDQYDKWVAQWSSRCSYKKPYKMWQYSATGSVNGINGDVDMDYLYN